MAEPIIREVRSRFENVNVCEREDRSHELVGIMTGSEFVPNINQCKVCGWIDTVALDATGEGIVRRSLAARAQRIAVAVESKPFTFVQSSTEELPMREIFTQALAAAYQSGIEATDNNFDVARNASILNALTFEHEQSVEQSMARRERSLRDGELKDWADLAYQLYALACNSSPNTGYPADKQAEWHKAFERLRARFHELLPQPKEEEIGTGDGPAGSSPLH